MKQANFLFHAFYAYWQENMLMCCSSFSVCKVVEQRSVNMAAYRNFRNISHVAYKRQCTKSPKHDSKSVYKPHRCIRRIGIQAAPTTLMTFNR